MKRSNWILLFSCLYLASNGIFYGFPLWLEQIKTLFDVEQSLVAAVGASIYAAQLISVVFAPLVAKLPNWCSTALASVMIALGYALLSLLAARVISAGAVSATVIAAALLLGLGTGVCFAVVTSQAVTSFSDARSLWVGGMMTLSTGIGGAVFAVLAAFVPFSTSMLAALGTTCVFALVCIPCLYFSEKIRTETGPPSAESPLIQVSSEGQNLVPKQPALTVIAQFLKSLRSWLVMLLIFCKVGVGSSFSSNLGAFVMALGPSKGWIVTYAVPIFACGQVIGRLLVVLISRKVGTLAVILITSISFAVILTLSVVVDIQKSSAALCAFVLLFSIAYGGMWSANTALVFEGSVKDRRQWLVLGALCFPIGAVAAYTLNIMVGTLYDAVADSAHHCVGTHCFQTAYGILAGASLACAIISIVLYLMNNKEKRSR